MLSTFIDERASEILSIYDTIWGAALKDFNKLNRHWLPYSLAVDPETGDAVFSMTVAGYAIEDLDVTFSNEGVLTIKSKASAKEDKLEYLHKGLATRAFTFALAMHPLYTLKEATLKHGILKVFFAKKAVKTKKVEVQSSL
jgi:molecular chaperone IbpA